MANPECTFYTEHKIHMLKTDWLIKPKKYCMNASVEN